MQGLLSSLASSLSLSLLSPSPSIHRLRINKPPLLLQVIHYLGSILWLLVTESSINNVKPSPLVFAVFVDADCVTEDGSRQHTSGEADINSNLDLV